MSRVKPATLLRPSGTYGVDIVRHQNPAYEKPKRVIEGGISHWNKGFTALSDPEILICMQMIGAVANNCSSACYLRTS